MTASRTCSAAWPSWRPPGTAASAPPRWGWRAPRPAAPSPSRRPATTPPRACRPPPRRPPARPQAAHLGRLVDDLLDVSRITRGKVALEKQPLDLACAVARAVEASRPLLDARRHELSVTLPPAPVWVDGDATRLAQILSNLLSNAAKYTPPGGHVRLSVEAGEGEAVIPGRGDRGRGPEQLLPPVLDPVLPGHRAPAPPAG